MTEQAWEQPAAQGVREVGDAVVRVRDLVFEYPSRRALHDVSFDVAAGSITALVGPNGAGKTTLLACVGALRTPYSGAIAVDGIDALERPRACHERVGYLSDFYGLYDDLTVRRCLLHAARTRRVPEASAALAAVEVAGRLGISQWLDAGAGTLSRGLRQRLGIAQAIIHRPRVLLLDEPASGLDPEARHALAGLMLGLRGEGMTLIVSSHILAELEDYSTEMLIMSEGRIIEHRRLRHGGADGERLAVRLASEDARLEPALARAGVSDLRVTGAEARFRLRGDAMARHELLKSLVDGGLAVSAFGPVAGGMQDAYLERLAATRQQAGGAGA